MSTAKIQDIYARTFDKGARIIGVTGSVPESGARTVARKLAEICETNGMTPLLVSRAGNDNILVPGCDLRNNTHNTFNPLRNAAIDNSGCFKEFLNNHAGEIGRVIMDLPPVAGEENRLFQADVDLCDAVVLVSPSIDKARDLTETALERLSEIQARVAGFMIEDPLPADELDELSREFTRISDLLPKGIQEYLETRNTAL